MGFIFKICTIIAGWAALLVLALSISAGLYLACELAEEFSSTVRRVLHRSIIGIGIAHIILILDGLPFQKCLIGIVAYISYVPLLATFPFVQPIGFATIWGFLVTLANHMNWFNYFISIEYRDELREHMYDETNYIFTGNPALRVMGFLFVFVWMVPLGFFISLTSIEESLPMSSPGGGMHQKKGKGIFKSFVDKMIEKKEAMYAPKKTRYQY